MFSETFFNSDWQEILRIYGYYFTPIILIICGLLILRQLPSRKLKLPPGPVGLPLVGYLPFLGKEPHRTLDNLTKKYGKIFSLYLGRKYVVVLADYQAVSEALSKSSTINRLPHTFDFIPDGGGVSGANDEEWVEQRKLVVRAMKEIVHGKGKWYYLVEDEVADFVKKLLSTNGCAVDFKEMLSDSVTNNISALLFGTRMPKGPDRERLETSLNTMLCFLSQSGLWNYYPWLCKIFAKLKIGSYHKIFSEMEVLHEVTGKFIDQYKEHAKESESCSFISEYITAMQNKRHTNTSLSEGNLIANTWGLFAGGGETVLTALTWLLLSVASHPVVQEKVHSEMDRVLGDEQRAVWEDRLKFPYTYAVILEALRWKTIVPINILRVATEDISIGGYDIPKNATMTSLHWGLHNDPRYWTEPEKFNPERFLEDGGNKVDLKKDSYVPFSTGKRKCPGDNVSMIQIFLYFTSIMQHFDIRTPSGGKPNLDGYLSITYVPVSQELCFVPRQRKQ